MRVRRAAAFACCRLALNWVLPHFVWRDYPVSSTLVKDDDALEKALGSRQRGRVVLVGNLSSRPSLDLVGRVRAVVWLERKGARGGMRGTPYLIPRSEICTKHS